MLDGLLLDFYLNNCLDQRKFQWFVGGIDRSIHLILLDDVLGSSLSFAHNIVDFDHSAVHLIDINKTLNSIDKIINYSSIDFTSMNFNCITLGSYPRLELHFQTCKPGLVNRDAHPARSSACVNFDHNTLQQHLLVSFEPSTQKGRPLCHLLLLGRTRTHCNLGLDIQNRKDFVYVNSSLGFIDNYLGSVGKEQWPGGKFNHNLNYHCFGGMFDRTLQ